MNAGMRPGTNVNPVECSRRAVRGGARVVQRMWEGSANIVVSQDRFK